MTSELHTSADRLRFTRLIEDLKQVSEPQHLPAISLRRLVSHGISFERLLGDAARLVEGCEDTEISRAYAVGVVETLIEAFRLSMDFKPIVAKAIGLPPAWMV